MTTFVSYHDNFVSLIAKLVLDKEVHSKWLNTLSLMENCGAKKIAQCQHPTKVSKEMLKHNAEEARHAHFLKRLCYKLSPNWDSYEDEKIIGGFRSRRYLDRLDIQICRYLKNNTTYTGDDFVYLAYLLTTFAIETRAEELYPIYQEALQKHAPSLSVSALINEEEEHLAEMNRSLAPYREKDELMAVACSLESKLCGEWLKSVEHSMG